MVGLIKRKRNNEKGRGSRRGGRSTPGGRKIEVAEEDGADKDVGDRVGVGREGMRVVGVGEKA